MAAYDKRILLTVPDDVWEPIGSEPDPDDAPGWWQDEGLPHEPDARSQLLACVEILGILHHLEAWEVYDDSDGVQQSVANQEHFDELTLAMGTDGAFQTVSIGGREYILVMSPYC